MGFCGQTESLEERAKTTFFNISAFTVGLFFHLYCMAFCAEMRFNAYYQ